VGSSVVFIETVGVGQSETEVREVADVVLVTLAPGFGDEIQLLKAGLLEIADLFIVNKADRPGASELYHALASMTQEERRPEANSSPRGVFLVSAARHSGIPEVLDHLDRMSEHCGRNWPQRRTVALGVR
jgi:LAO/AO transport system kinase